MASSEPMLEKHLLSSVELTPREIREQRRIRAKTYRDLYLLPRYVIEEDGSKRKLEAGEYDANSKLYPLCTPVKDLSDFGKDIVVHVNIVHYIVYCCACVFFFLSLCSCFVQCLIHWSGYIHDSIFCA